MGLDGVDIKTNALAAEVMGWLGGRDWLSLEWPLHYNFFTC